MEEHGGNKAIHKHSKELQRRHLELVLSSCQALCSRNLEGTREYSASPEVEVGERTGNSSRHSSAGRRSLGKTGITRAKTTAFSQRLILKKRFNRRASAEFLRKRSMIKNEALDREPSSEGTLQSESLSPLPKLKKKTTIHCVKKTGRGKRKPSLLGKARDKKEEKVRFKKKHTGKTIKLKGKKRGRPKGKKNVETGQGKKGRR